MLRSLIIILIFAATGSCLAQDPIPRIDNKDLPRAIISATRSFKGPALFGYMDGGAELYLEYGFEEASITELTLTGEKYKVEIFKMNGQEEAFGIFSVSRFNCRSTPKFTESTCQTKYQLQVCRGSHYISIICRKGNQTDSLNMLEIGKLVSSKITGPDFDLSSYFPETPSTAWQSKCFLARGKLGIVNGAPDLEDYFSGITGYSAAVLNLEKQRILSIKFLNQESMKKFCDLHKWDAGTLTITAKVMPGGEEVSKLAENHIYIISAN
jgi:hypothetical protein